jgi:hypothetical protein
MEALERNSLRVHRRQSGHMVYGNEAEKQHKIKEEMGKAV